MQFVTHRDPVNVGGGATALGAAGEAINNLLGIYAGYKNQQLEEKRRKEDMAMKQQQLDIQKREAERQDVMDQLRIRQEQIAAANKLGARPDVEGTMEVKTRQMNDLVSGTTNEPAPLDLGQFTPDAHKPDAVKTGVEPPKPPVTGTQTWQTVTPEPKQYVPIAGVRDASGRTIVPESQQEVRYQPEIEAEANKQLLEREIALGRQVRLTPEERAALAQRFPGLGARETLPEDTYTRVMTPAARSTAPPPHIVDPVTGEIKMYDPNTGTYTKSGGRVGVRQNAQERQEEVDAKISAEVNRIKKGDPSSLPDDVRAQVLAITEGRQAPPTTGNRPNSPGARILALASAYSDSDYTALKARFDAGRQLAGGSATSRGGQITNLNTFASHLNVLQDKADKLNEHLANSDWQTINYLDQKFTRSGKKGPIAAYNDAANTFITEYIKTLKGASPTDQEQREFKRIRDTTLSPAERQASIDTLKQFVESRANEQETWYEQQFGRSSAADKATGVSRPWLGGDWRYNPDTGQWTIGRRGQTDRQPAGESAEARRKRLLGQPGETTLGAPQTTYGLTKPPGV